MNKLITILFLTNFICCSSFATKKSVVLPARFAENPVVVANTPQYKNLLVKNKELIAQAEKEKIEKERFSKNVENQKRINDQIQSELLNKYNDSQLKIEKQGKIIAEQIFSLWFWRIAFFGLLAGIIAYLTFRTYLKTTFPIISNFLP